MQSVVVGGRVERGESEIVDDPVGATFAKFGIGRGGAKRQDAGARSFAGANAGGRVFDDDAISGSEAEVTRGFDIRLGIGLAARDVV